MVEVTFCLSVSFNVIISQLYLVQIGDIMQYRKKIFHKCIVRFAVRLLDFHHCSTASLLPLAFFLHSSVQLQPLNNDYPCFIQTTTGIFFLLRANHKGDSLQPY